jgi:excisionase family DNA binding protein
MMSLHDAAERLGVHYMTVYRYIRTGRLPAVKDGGTWHVNAADLDALRPGAPEPAIRRGSRQWARHSSRLLDRLQHADEAGAWQVLDSALIGGARPAEVYVRVLAPALREIGDRWAAGDASVADEHRVTALAQRLIGRCGPRFARPGRRRGTVLLGAAPGDYHDLPVAMLADVLRGESYDVVELGAATPAESFATSIASSPSLVAVGISIGSVGRLAAARKTIVQLRDVAPAVPLIVGGPAVSDKAMADRLDADGWAPDALKALDLLDALSSARHSG